MAQLASEAGRKLAAFAVLALAAYVLFKLVLGVVTGVVFMAIAVMAVFAVIWAVRTL